MDKNRANRAEGGVIGKGGEKGQGLGRRGVSGGVEEGLVRDEGPEVGGLKVGRGGVGLDGGEAREG